MDKVSDELYSVPPQDFTALRSRRVAEAKAAGQAHLARQIGQLRKPSVTAWLANQLAREYPDELQPLIELGDALRTATATLSGEQLRTLGRQQNQVVQALVRQGRVLAEDAGQRISQDTERGLADTLHAALADPQAAALLLQGRLSAPLSGPGFGDGVGAGDDAPPRPVTDLAQARARRATSEQVEANRAAQVAEARRSAEAAEQERAESEAVAQATAAEVDQAQADVDRLGDELDQARDRLAACTREARRAQRELATREATVRRRVEALTRFESPS